MYYLKNLVPNYTLFITKVFFFCGFVGEIVTDCFANFVLNTILVEDIFFIWLIQIHRIKTVNYSNCNCIAGAFTACMIKFNNIFSVYIWAFEQCHRMNFN